MPSCCCPPNFLPPALTLKPTTHHTHFQTTSTNATTMYGYHMRSVSAPVWGNVPSTPTSPSTLPSLARPRASRTMTTTTRPPPRTCLHLTPRPPVFSAFPGDQDVPAAAESSTFALLERCRDKQVMVFCALPTPAPPGAGLAERRRRKGPRLVLWEEEWGICEEKCCAAWSV
jgi:hypothetical protein